MEREATYTLLAAAAERTGLPFELLAAQVGQESDFDAGAISPAGALGLMQLMPASFTNYSKLALLRPEVNVRLGSEFLKECVAMWKAETREEALKFGLASYNGGSAYVLAAQSAAGAGGADTARWDSVSPFLAKVEVAGRRPDVAQITEYVTKIWQHYQALLLCPIAGFGAGAKPQLSSSPS